MSNILEGEGTASKAGTEEKTASEIIVDELLEAGVKHVFGIPGHTCLGIVEALRKQKDIDFITVRHEETAALMASAYAKLTDRLGVVLTIAGPGATNLMTGLYDAKMDHAPVLALTGQVDLQFIGRDALQEIDQNALFEPVSLFNKVITTGDETAEITLLAIKNALVRRGVSHLGVPVNIQRQKTAQQVKPLKGRVPQPRIRPSEELCKKAADMINSADRPMIILGWGARFAADRCLELAEKIGAPVATTFKAKGIVSEFHPQSVGVHGSVGPDPSKELAHGSDLLIVLGSSFSAQTAIPSDKPVIQVDYDSLALGKRFPVELSLWGSVEDTVPILTSLAKERDNKSILRNIEMLMQKWRQKIEPVLSSDEVPIHPARVLRALQKVIPEEAMISIDAGDNSWWFGKYFRVSKQRFMLSGYLATMAFGFAAALGAGFAYPSVKSIALTGDGAFSMVMADFTTAVKYHLPVVAIVYDNNELSMITHEQRMEGFPKYATELVNPNFADFAESCGGDGYDVRQPEELEPALEKAMDSRKPCIVDVHTNPTKYWMTEHS
ncbi:MAG: thiamine pyrophosphate-binding protein [Promethearchaeati archaeon SRVP18_Atabeyarchaeia-1]